MKTRILAVALSLFFLAGCAGQLKYEDMNSTAKCLHDAKTQADRNECMWDKAADKKD